MLSKLAKRTLRTTAAWFGCEVRRLEPNASPARGIDSMEQLLRFLQGRGLHPRCVLDVGANRASWSNLAASVFPEARFVLIEPQEEMRPHITSFCAEHPAAQFIQAGAGAEPGELVQTIWDDLAGSSFLPPSNQEHLKTGKQRKTPIVTIDSVFAGKEVPELVKLDIQGFELEALKGATRLFGRTECFVLEVSLFRFLPGTPDFFEIVEFMHRRGYQVYDICGYLRRPLDGALGQLDVVFARSNGPLCADTRWSEAEGRLAKSA